jgi:hypothetical protein
LDLVSRGAADPGDDDVGAVLVDGGDLRGFAGYGVGNNEGGGVGGVFAGAEELFCVLVEF